MTPTGILWQGRSPIDGGPIVAIVTDASRNRKTGRMLQVWIMRADIAPHHAREQGKDRSVCGDCRHRDGTCYVTLVHAPLSVWRAYKRGSYQRVTLQALKGERIRWGAYGDPGALPFALVSEVSSIASGTVGYTHLWRKLPGYWARFLMASVDTIAEQKEAKGKGYRTFRIRRYHAKPLQQEISCPAMDKRTQCSRCMLCSGMQSPNAPSISVVGHGPLKVAE